MAPITREKQAAIADPKQVQLLLIQINKSWH